MSGKKPGAEKGSSFSLGFKMLPQAKREALSAVYAYCRLIDDIVDSGSLSKDEQRRMLSYWRDEVERLYAGAPTHSISSALAGPIAEYKLPKEEFQQMIRGCALDVEGKRYETIADLEDYMRGVASSVGILSVHIFGWKHTPPEKMREFAITFGYAFQLTNILRDVGADLELGRVYLPLADLRAANCSLERLVAREYSPEFRSVMEAEYRRAREYYSRARALVDPRDRPAMFPAEVMARVYEGVLERVKEQDFHVLFQKTTLPGPRKLALALRAWLYSHVF